MLERFLPTWLAWRGVWFGDMAMRGRIVFGSGHVLTPFPACQVPRTSEIYIHRSGRTARATREGLSLMLIGPEDVINFKKIYKTLKKDEDIPPFPVQTKYMDVVKVKEKSSNPSAKREPFTPHIAPC